MACSREEMPAQRADSVIYEELPAFPYSHICEDSDNNIWLGTPYSGVFRYDGHYCIGYTSGKSAVSLSSKYVNHVFSDAKGNIWVATQNGVDRFDRQSNGFVHYPVADSNSYILRLGEDNGGNIYALSKRFLFQLDESSGQFMRKIELADEISVHYSFFFGEKNDIWIVLDHSVEHYDNAYNFRQSYSTDAEITDAVFLPESRLVILQGGIPLAISLETCAPEKESVLPKAFLEAGHASRIFAVGKDTFLLTSPSGSKCFRTSTLAPVDISVLKEENSAALLASMNAIYEDSIGNTWISGTSGKLAIIPRDMEIEAPDSPLIAFLRENCVVSTCSSPRYKYLVTDTHSLFIYDLADHVFVAESNLDKLLGLNPIFNYRVSLAPNGKLLVSNEGKGFLFRISEKAQLDQEMVFYNNNPALQQIYISDNAGTVWAAGIGSSIYRASSSGQGVHAQVPMEMIHDSIKDMSVMATDALLLPQGDIVFSFTDIGLVRINPSTGEYTTVSLPDAGGQFYIRGMLADERGNVWVYCSDKGLYCYHIADGTIAQVSELQARDITGFASDKDGGLFVQSETAYYGSNGEGSFELLRTDPFAKTVGITLHTLPNGSVVASNAGGLSPLRYVDTGVTQELSIPLDVMLSSEHSLLGYLNFSSERQKNKVVLERDVFSPGLYFPVSEPFRSDFYNYYYAFGHRGDWTPAYDSPFIPLYKLSYGSNVIRFKVQRASDRSQTPIYTLVIWKKYPWYIPFSAICLCAIAAALVYLLAIKKRRDREVEAAAYEKKILEETNNNNIDFFANISHEFRTPLALISGAVDNLLEGGEPLSLKQKRMSGIISRNTGRMLRLVNQMLDFNKLDHGMLSLSVQLQDISTLLIRVCDTFRLGAETKSISLDEEGLSEPLLGWIDSDKMEKILFNLLSNALKYTPEGGRVKLSLSTLDGAEASALFNEEFPSDLSYALVAVEDSGIGIPEDKINFIFERFARLESTQKAGGTGIGLYFTKSLVTLHHGQIKAENRSSEESGTRFVFTIPIAESAYSEKERSVTETTPQESPAGSSASEVFASESGIVSSARPTVLVIDDDYEFVYFLKSILENQYQVLFRFDAMSGYKVIEESGPDIVISDVMMAGVDGLQLCRMVKENRAVCHIPFVLLTAKNMMRDQIDGLTVGADAYLTKPFNSQHLLATIQSLLENRKRIQQVLTENTSPLSLSNSGLSDADKEFMEQLYSLLEASLDGEDVSVDDIASSLHMGRSKFYNKVKALTGRTPNDVFTIYKLNRAIDLLKTGKYKISAVAAMVGFNSPSHFSTVFKKYTGVFPSQFIHAGGE